MKKNGTFLASLLIALVAFYAWHTPLQGPLTDAEVEAFMTTPAANAGTSWSDEAAFEAFLGGAAHVPDKFLHGVIDHRILAQFSLDKSEVQVVCMSDWDHQNRISFVPDVRAVVIAKRFCCG